MKYYLDCSSLTHQKISGIGVYNKNLFLELNKLDHIIPVLKWSRFSKGPIVKKHLGTDVSFLPPLLLDKKIVYHGTDHKLNTRCLGPSVVTIHDMQPFEDKWLDPKFAENRRAIINKTLTSDCNKFIAVSHFTRQEIIKYYPAIESKIEVVYHGYNFPEDEPAGINNLKEKLHDRPFLLFLGNIEERKNLINQFYAFELLKKDYPELLLVVAGNAGYNYATIAEVFNKSPHKGSVIFSGYLNEVEKKFALSETSCLMFASWYEGFGIPVIEALAYNSNVLISKGGALEEIAGEICHSATPSDIGDIYVQTRNVMENGNKTVVDMNEWKEKWSWKNSALATMKIYKSLN